MTKHSDLGGPDRLGATPSIQIFRRLAPNDERPTPPASASHRNQRDLASLNHRHAAIDVQGLTGDVGCFITGEIDASRSDF